GQIAGVGGGARGGGVVPVAGNHPPICPRQTGGFGGGGTRAGPALCVLLAVGRASGAAIARSGPSRLVGAAGPRARQPARRARLESCVGARSPGRIAIGGGIVVVLVGAQLLCRGSSLAG